MTRTDGAFPFRNGVRRHVTLERTDHFGALMFFQIQKGKVNLQCPYSVKRDLQCPYSVKRDLLQWEKSTRPRAERACYF
jgi:hypothetical protein